MQMSEGMKKSDSEEDEKNEYAILAEKLKIPVIKKYETVKVDGDVKNDMTEQCVLGASIVRDNTSPAEGI